jgi:heat shock protein HtpX
MEMCIDNPRTGFSNIFDTHPSVDARCAAIVKFAGGHDPGPLAIEPPEQSDGAGVEEQQPERLPHGPWNQDQSDRSAGPWGDAPPRKGPWGPRQN